MLVIAGLDKRFGWGSLSPLWSPVGLILVVLGSVPSAWAISLNPHFEPTVRIQEERGHRVISTGPYRYVRHPGYLSAILTSTATPLLLGTPWAFLPVGAIIVVLVIRTALEDRVLRRELTGYREYAQRVRWRLFPGIW
ncbi:MAG: isoprenylcysteine carboxylmethyltransferase family protein [Candidatus Aminicenantaceae bacterium]